MMSKQDTNALRANAGTAKGLSNTYSQGAAATGSILTPTLNRLAAGGGGYTPTQANNQTTAALQSIGGATAGAVGEAANRAATTNNVGADGAFRLAAAHDATSQLSDAAIGVQARSADLAAQQQGAALGQLGTMYGQQIGAGENALGLSTQATNAAEQASQNGFWRGVAQNAINSGMSYGMGRLPKGRQP